ncbi:MAG TPA: diguanylate cyclase [Xanthobacteraceae bacterium]|nr:diguanylate cyclase [Xanthobacteraceae bacterium]
MTRPATISSSRSAAPRARWLNWTIAFALCLSAGLIGIETWQMWHVREASLRSAKIVTASLAETVSQQIETTLRTADTVVASLVQRAEVDGTDPESRKRMYELMTSLAAALPAIHEMGLTDKDGNAIVKSLVPNPTGMNYRERDYFRYLSSHDTREVFIGTPVNSKIDGSVNITVSRRINSRDGTFAGVVVTSVSMDFFRQLFQSLQLKSSGSIAMLADNGTLLAASPASFGEGELDALAASPSDALEYIGPDGVRRVGSYNRLSHYPITAVVAEDSPAILAEWHGQLRVHLAIVMSILAAIAAVAYQLDQAHRATRMQALRDGLTGLANRRCFNETIEREFRRATRHGQPLSLVMMDIDLFKNFNDRYGHPAGDACLRAVSTAVQDALRRPADLAARYGGEEIAVLLPGTNVAGAVQIVEEIAAAIRALAIPHAASPHGVVTLSAGVASLRVGRRVASWASLVEAADTALYAAKALGRNTFTVHPNVAPATRARAAPENAA